ncbi:MAG TPA: hypothetical protein GX730_01000 [Chloroflexi bacterium]|jgi:hypothetical protein|nr:hypothetical protein [Anaerolineaceae bacterium]HHX07999.1 hypothetical protein [Chloroflexota bacterium]
MSDLSSVTNRLEQLFMDTYQLSLPADLKEEAIRSSLEEINSLTGQTYSLTGLDEQLQTTLPAEFQTALLRGAAAVLVEAILQHKLVTYSNLLVEPTELQAWARCLRQERDQLLDHLRFRSLRESEGIPWCTWVYPEAESYD